MIGLPEIFAVVALVFALAVVFTRTLIRKIACWR